MNYRVRRALFTAVMVVAMLAASAATAAEAPETLPAPNEGVTHVDGAVDKAPAAEIDHTAATVDQDAAVDRAVTATETVAEMTGNVMEPMGPTAAAMGGMGASSAAAVNMGTSPPANAGHVEGAAAENAVRIQGLGNEVAERAGPMDVGKVVDDVGRVDGVPVAVAAPTYEHRAPETPAPDTAALEPQDKFQQGMSPDAQEVMGIPPTIAFG